MIALWRELSQSPLAIVNRLLLAAVPNRLPRIALGRRRRFLHLSKKTFAKICSPVADVDPQKKIMSEYSTQVFERSTHGGLPTLRRTRDVTFFEHCACPTPF